MRARKVYVDAADLPALARVLTAFESARQQGVSHETRQKYTSQGGLELDTFWDGKERVVAISSPEPCELSAFLGESALAALRDAVSATLPAPADR